MTTFANILCKFSLVFSCHSFITAIPNPVIDSQPIFNLPTQSGDTDPPWFTLSFNVNVAPPTYVTCSLDNNPFDSNTPVDVADLSRQVVAGQYLPPSTASPVTTVTVTLRTRQTGNYWCTVSVFRASMVDTTNDLTDVTSATVFVTG